MSGTGFIIAGAACIGLAILLFVFLMTWLRKKKRELKKRWEI